MNNCLISRDGTQTDCLGGMHENICKQRLKVSLKRFLQSMGGVRIVTTDYIMAVEFYGPVSKQQNAIINRIIKEQPIYTVVMPKAIITKYRAIRSLNLC